MQKINKGQQRIYMIINYYQTKMAEIQELEMLAKELLNDTEDFREGFIERVK